MYHTDACCNSVSRGTLLLRLKRADLCGLAAPLLLCVLLTSLVLFHESTRVAKRSWQI